MDSVAALSTIRIPATVTEERGSRIGLDPIDRCFVMENHDEAYRIWHNAGVRQKILIHFDAHHDMWWLKDGAPITYANFICAALREDIVREIFWVVPDRTWESSRRRKAVIRHLRNIRKKYPGSSPAQKGKSNQISTSVFQKPLTVCSLDSLPNIEEKVLLDIDVDYLVIPFAPYGESDTHDEVPWCWPKEFLSKMLERKIRSDLVTIAYSVEGGHTPLKWKYLGDELELRLKQPNDGEPIISGMELIRKAALAANRGNHVIAEEKYQEARNFLPKSAAPCYHLAQLYADRKRIEDGQKLYQQVLDLEPSYRTAYNSAGLHYHWERRFRQEEEEHKRVLALDPQDAYAHFGLGRLAARKKRWNEAEVLLKKSLELNANLIDAHRALGDVLVKQGRLEEAIKAYEWSLKLALNGHKDLGGPIITCNEDDRRLKDSNHCYIHGRLARLYELKGDITRAITGYRISIAGGEDGVIVRSRLARLYLKQNQWRKAIEESWQAVKMIPVGLRRIGRQLFGRLKLAIKNRIWGVTLGCLFTKLKGDILLKN